MEKVVYLSVTTLHEHCSTLLTQKRFNICHVENLTMKLKTLSLNGNVYVTTSKMNVPKFEVVLILSVIKSLFGVPIALKSTNLFLHKKNGNLNKRIQNT